jgi:hypothetical protein
VSHSTAKCKAKLSLIGSISHRLVGHAFDPEV